MKKNILPKSLKKVLMLSLISASLCGAITPEEVQASPQLSSIVTQLAQSTQKEIPATSEIKDFNPMVFLDGNPVTFKNAIKNYKGSTYLPFREVGDLIGANAEWNSEYRVAKFTKDGTIVEIVSQTDKSVVSKDGNIEKVTITNGSTNIPALNINGSTYVPIRYLSESFGMDIQYNVNHPETGTKTITINQHSNLNYQKLAKPEVDPINIGKLPTAPDGVDYNAKWLEYLKGNKKFADPSGKYAPKADGDFNKLFSQTHPKTGAKAIPGLFYIDSEGFRPVYDHDGDGKLGGKKISELSINDINGIEMAYYDDAVDLAVKLEGLGQDSYVIDRQSAFRD